MFAHNGKYSDSRLDTGPAATPQGVDLPLVNGSIPICTITKDMDPDSSVLCDTQISCNSNANTSEKTILLEEIQESDTNKSLESSVSFEVPNISQNFTLNVGPSVGNIAAIQNVVPGGSPTLWLPTIITSSTAAASDDHVLEGQIEGSSGNLSQIILSGSGSHSSPVLTTSSGIQANNKYTPKVQIVTIPKQGSCMKSMVHTSSYVNQNEIIKNRNNGNNIHSSVVNNQLLLQPQSKNTSSLHASTVPQFNHQHNNNNNNKVLSSSTAGNITTTTPAHQHHHQSHVLSRVVPGPKLSSQAIGRNLKNSANTMQYQKVTGRTTNFSNVLQPQSSQPPMSVKIIQQQNVPLNNKSALKSVPPNRTGMLSAKQRNSASNSSYNQMNSHKAGNYSKGMSGVNVTKSVGRSVPQRLVVQQTPSRLMMSSNVGSHKGSTYYQHQSNSDNMEENLKYNPHQSYMTMESNASFNSSSNQSLTAQILQSLSQPKIISSRLVPIHGNMSPVQYDAWDDNVLGSEPYNQCKQIQGDSTILTQPIHEDTLGVEERPNLPDDSLSYHYYSLQLVLLDHTYAVTPQSVAVSSSANINTPTMTNTSVSSSAHVVSTGSPVCSPVKVLPSPTKCQSPLAINQTCSNTPIENNYNYSNITSRMLEDGDDDAGSVLSSIDGDERRQGDRNGSDTETAPEGEGEEEGKTRCVCDFTHDDGYMICCDRCGEWQHVDCMAIDRQNIPDDYMCDRCQPRLIDRKRARSIQMRKKEELTGLYSSASDSSSGPSGGQKKALINKAIGPQKKLLTVTTYSNTISGVSRTVPMLPPPQSCNYTATAPYNSSNSVPPVVNNKRGPKRTRRVDSSRKGPKRKLQEKKIRRKSDVAKYRNKYGMNSSQQTSQWSESYELAVTNHYSPELRAKIARYSSNKIALNYNVTSSVLTAYFCTTVPHAGSKILIATKDMKENSPIIELRGKYMLSTQHKPQLQQAGRAGSQKPGPYLFFYKFPKDTTQVCIDTRTYGNEARFVRRSCKPNAELQHCIIKGALHVYLITVTPIQSNTEITIRHETSGGYQPCACGNPKHCKQAPPPNTDIIVHKNNGASLETSGRERRGRTRQANLPATNLPSVPGITSPHRKEVLSPKLDKRRKSEPESVVHDDIKEDVKSDGILKSTIKVELNLESDLEAIKGVEVKEESLIEELPIPKAAEPVIKEEKSEENKQNLLPKEICKVEEPIDIKLELNEESLEAKTVPQPLLSPTLLSNSENTTLKSKDHKANRSLGARRASTHSVRTTRASLSASNAAESADEKSDSQTECKATTKEKKKMTREERKMEAIVKAIERMEKAEQRKLENKDKQTKRRESDPQQSCSVTSSTECKDITHGDQSDEMQSQQKSSMKGRPRRRGRSRTISQNQAKNMNRINSVDSDNIGTSDDEHNPLLMSPSRKSVSSENHLDSTRLIPTESACRQSLEQTDEALKQTLDDHFIRKNSNTACLDTHNGISRINLNLSSVCLLVEAAVAPLETTFKSPKTKKAIMNEWLSKSPEPNISYDSGSPDYGSTDNNNTSEHYVEKQTFMGRKSTESLVKAASTMIGNLSGGIISADSTPEKYAGSDPSDNENSSLTKNTPEYSSPPIIHSPVTYPQRNLKRVTRDLSRDPGEKNRTPKKIKRGLRNTDPSPLKRSLRSGVGNRDLDFEGSRDMEEKSTKHRDVESPSPVAACLPPPPQHSAKKRWLRQAISEESDSPTAESPPSEMLTPLKKRRLARESLTSEPVTLTQSEDVQLTPLPSIPVEETSNDTFDSSAPVEKHCLVVHGQGAMKENIESEDDTAILESNSVINDRTISVSADCIEAHEMRYADEVACENKKEVIINNNNEEENVINVDTREKTDETSCDTIINNENKTPVKELKCESSNVNSTETSCNSSPVVDEMDDIQKKIHSFHTENIQILKIRNKKQPKEKRKKVNLNFDLSVLDNETVEVKLKCEKDTVVLDSNELNKSEVVSWSSGVEGVNNKNNSVVDTQDEMDIGIVENTRTDVQVEKDDNTLENKDSTKVENKFDISNITTSTLNSHFPSTILFSDSFPSNPNPSLTDHSSVVSNESSTSVPDLNIIKNVIDTVTVNLENSVFKDTGLNTIDEYKNVEEILSRVNQMDSRNSVLLSGLMKDSNMSLEETLPPKVSQPPRTNDPRLNPPPSDKPKPIRRKLSITEYRRRHSMIHPSESSSSPPPAAVDPSPQPQLSDEEEGFTQFEKNLVESLTKLDDIMSKSNMNVGLFNPQPTVHEKHREKLSERLRREFGLSIPEEETACSPVVSDKKPISGSGEQKQEEEGISGGLALPPLSDPPSHLRLDG